MNWITCRTVLETETRDRERERGSRRERERERVKKRGTHRLHTFFFFSSSFFFKIQDGERFPFASLSSSFLFLFLPRSHQSTRSLRLSPSHHRNSKKTKSFQSGRPVDDEFSVPPPDDRSDVDSHLVSDLDDDDDDAGNDGDDAAERATSPGDTEGEDLMENMEG